MTDKEIVGWLLEGDISIQYLTHLNLLGKQRNDLKDRISEEGWGKKYLSSQNSNGHWGRGYYQPKWTSTHYTLLDLRNLGTPQSNDQAKTALDLILDKEKGSDGGINPSLTISNSDVCMNGMVLNFGSYFNAEKDKLKSIVDFILTQKMKDGGFNCHLNRKGAIHSSLHSTTSVAEGILQYRKQGYTYRANELHEAEKGCREFILKHRLFLSDRTGKIIKNNFLRLFYPWRWYFNILRGLVYFCEAGMDYDERMAPAIDILKKKRKKDGRWSLQAHLPGHRHFDFEETGNPSRWNTLFALWVFKHFNIA